MFAQTAVFSSLALLASVAHAVPSTYTPLHLRAIDKRVTKEGIFWLKDTAGPIFDEEYQGPLGIAIATNPTMRIIFQDTWDASFPTSTTAQEEGGWVFADPANPARIAVCRATRSRTGPLNQDTVQLEDSNHTVPAVDLKEPECNPSAIPEGFVVVANFHTHPMPWENSDCSSEPDKRNAWERGVPGIVIHQGGLCVYGPPARDMMKGQAGAYPQYGEVYSGQKAADKQIRDWAPTRAKNQSM